MPKQQPSEPTWIVEWFVILFLGALVVCLLVAKANGDSHGKTVLIVKKCGSQLCADPMMTPRLVLKLNHGERPLPGQVLKCSLAARKLYCGNGVEIEVESVMLQAVE